MNIFFDTNISLASSNNPLLYAFVNSDLCGQGICILLFLISIITWVLMFERSAVFKKAQRDNDRFLRQFRSRKNPLGVTNDVLSASSPMALLYSTVCEKISAFHLTSTNGRRALNDAELGMVKTTLEQALEDQLVKLDDKMILLATIVSVSPFLGLLGTVWGITIAFTNLAIEGSGSIKTLAPGGSGALLTTVIALIVVIPTLVGYNLLLAKIKRITVSLDNFSEEFLSRLKIEQMDSYAASQTQQILQQPQSGNNPF